jgi:branched-chain amino acid transport system permease protein
VTDFLQYTVFGVILGAGFAIAAAGLVVTYTTSGVFNFAQGAVGMIAAFGYWEMVANHHVPAWLALVIILLVAAPIAGGLVERVLMRRLHGASAERPIMVTLGLLVILTGVATIAWPPTGQYQLNPIVSGTFRLVGINLQYQQVLTIGVAIVLVVGLRFLFYSTRTGIGLRAVVDDPGLLAMSGASPNRMSQYGWILGFMMAALAGVLLALTQEQTGISIVTMTLLVVNGYAAAVVGRLKNIPVTFVAAIVIGLLEEYIIYYALPHLSQNLNSDISLALPMVFLFVALVMLPSVRIRAVGRLSTVRVPRIPSGRESLVFGAAFLVVAVIASSMVGNVLIQGTSLLDVGGEIMAFGMVGLSLVLLTGYSGQVSLCQFSFMGIGAFVMGKMAGGGSVLGLVVAAGVCALLGALVALPTIRLRDLYFALATFAFADAVDQGFFGDSRVFGGGLNVNRITLPGLSFLGDQSEFLLVTVFFILSALLVLAIRRSLFGRRLVAMNDSPAAYATVGLNLAFTKVAVFAIAAAMAAVAGGLYSTVNGTVSESDFAFFSGIIFVLFVTVWSVRTVTGAFLAAVTYVVLNTYWPTGIGLVAGGGIILIGRAASGLLGIERLTTLVPLPWVKRPASGASRGEPGSDAGGAVVGEPAPALGGGARVAG